MIDITDANFQKEVIEKSKEIPVLVDFWASWCGPCMMLGPILEKIASSEKYKDKFILAKCDVEKCQLTATRFGIMSIPAVKLFKDSEVVADFVGARSEADIKEFMDKYLG